MREIGSSKWDGKDEKRRGNAKKKTERLGKDVKRILLKRVRDDGGKGEEWKQISR